MISRTDVGRFYDRFSRETQLEYFCHLNIRLEAIKDLCDRFIPDRTTILEIGCGVGIVSKHLQRKASRMLAVDISEVNITIAQMYAQSPVCQFRIIDITEDTSDLMQYAPFEVVVLADVIEHIPKQKHRDLFGSIERLLAPGGLVLITMPSPQYQEYIRKHNPEILQVVDETVTVAEILASTSLAPLFFEYRHVWAKNQYLHLILQSEIDYSPTVAENLGLLARAMYRIRNTMWRTRNRGFLGKVRDILQDM